MKSKRHRLLAGVLCVLAVLTMMLSTGNVAWAKEEPAEAAHEENLTVGEERVPVATGAGSAFAFDNNTGTITGYNGSDAVVTIPADIGGVAVTTVGEGAFQNNVTLEAVTIPASVRTIGKEAFSGCTNLKRLTLSEGLTTIEEDAFNSNKALEQLTLPASVTTIGKEAFVQCTELKHLALGKGIKTIEERAFAGTMRLPSLTIPAGVETIGEYAFDSCGSEVEGFTVTFEAGTTPLTLGALTFFECRTMKKITLPGRIQKVPDNIFHACGGLEEVVLEEGVKEIGSDLFNGCNKLKDVVIPSSVTTIASDALRSLSGDDEQNTHVHIRQYRGDSTTVTGEPWGMDAQHTLSFLKGKPAFSWKSVLAENKRSSTLTSDIQIKNGDQAQEKDDQVVVEKVIVREPRGLIREFDVTKESELHHAREWIVGRNGDYTVEVQYRYLGTRTYTNPVSGIELPPRIKKEEKATLRFLTGGGHFADGTEEKVYEVVVGDHFTIPEGPEKEGATFLYWEGSKYDPGDDYIVPKGGHTFTAVWEKKEEEKKPETKPADADRPLPSIRLLEHPVMRIPKAGVGQSK